MFCWNYQRFYMVELPFGFFSLMKSIRRNGLGGNCKLPGAARAPHMQRSFSWFVAHLVSMHKGKGGGTQLPSWYIDRNLKMGLQYVRLYTCLNKRVPQRAHVFTQHHSVTRWHLRASVLTIKQTDETDARRKISAQLSGKSHHIHACFGYGYACVNVCCINEVSVYVPVWAPARQFGLSSFLWIQRWGCFLSCSWFFCFSYAKHWTGKICKMCTWQWESVLSPWLLWWKKRKRFDWVKGTMRGWPKLWKTRMKRGSNSARQ